MTELNIENEVIESCGKEFAEVVYIDGMIDVIHAPTLKELYSKADEVRQAVDVKKVIVYTGNDVEVSGGRKIAETVTMHGDFARNGTFGTPSLGDGYGHCY